MCPCMCVCRWWRAAGTGTTASAAMRRRTVGCCRRRARTRTWSPVSRWARTAARWCQARLGSHKTLYIYGLILSIPLHEDVVTCLVLGARRLHAGVRHVRLRVKLQGARHAWAATAPAWALSSKGGRLGSPERAHTRSHLPRAGALTAARWCQARLNQGLGSGCRRAWATGPVPAFSPLQSCAAQAVATPP